MASRRAGLTCLVIPCVLSGAGKLQENAFTEVHNRIEPPEGASSSSSTLSAPWNGSFDSDITALLKESPRLPNMSIEDDLTLLVEVPPWSNTTLNDTASPVTLGNVTFSIAGIEHADNGGSCAKYGCLAHTPFHRCQCDYQCQKYGNCCPDYHKKCSAFGGGRIIASRAWVALLSGQSDTHFGGKLCGIVKHFAQGPICHNGLIFEGQVAGRRGFFFLEYGHSGFPDVLTGRKKFGLQIIVAAQRLKGQAVLARRVYGDLTQLSEVVEQVRNTPYVVAPGALLRLLRRTNMHFSEHLWCSDFIARVLVAVGCLHGDRAAFNAQPTDFSSAAASHQLHYSCPVEPDRLWHSRG